MWQEMGRLSGYKSNITNMLLTQTQRATSTTFFRVQQCTLGSGTPDEYAAKQKKKKKPTYIEEEESSPPCVQFL